LPTKHSDYTRRAGKSNRRTRQPILQSIGEPVVATEGMKAVIPFFPFAFLLFTFDLYSVDD
jgi:hypothetical protein